MRKITPNKRFYKNGFLWYIPTETQKFFKGDYVMSKPISIQAAYAEGSTTIPEGSRAQVSSKRPAPEHWGDDIVCSSRKREAALKKLVSNFKISDKGCWEWQGSKTNGYGTLKIPEIYGQFKILAHRLSWVAFKGMPIENGLFVCHRCDNPACFNPDHLFLGTQRQNLEDCAKKKRTMTGQLNGNSRYTEAEILKVVELLKSGKTGVEVHVITGISKTHISRIKKGYTWAHKTREAANHINHNRRYSDEQILKAAQMIKEGSLKVNEIAKLAGVSRYTVTDMRRGKLYQRFMERVRG